MLLDFIASHREDLIARTRLKVAKRLAPRPTERELESGVPLFLDQLAETLRLAPRVLPAEMDRTAAVHGAALLGLGYTIAQVVHDYGDVCQAITELAIESAAPIDNHEFHTLNLCLDNAIAQAVTEYSRLRDQSFSAAETERSGVFAHELRNRIATAQLGFSVIQSGHAPVGGSVAAVVNRSFKEMASLVTRALVEVRVESGTAKRQRVPLFKLIEDAGVEASLEAGPRKIALDVAATDPTIDVDVDPQLIAGALANLVQNACKFTRAGGHVILRSAVIDRRVRVDVEDSCGGLPAGKADELFHAFEKRGTDRSGLGLGLFISRRSVEACGGVLLVRDLPGRGCIFAIDLPVMSPPL
jgi:signal transduction histidine kinase